MSNLSDQSVLESFPWINLKFVQQLIDNYEQHTNTSIKSFDAKFAFKNGENFSSHMVALSVVYINQHNDDGENQKDFIVKISIQTEDYAKVCKECQIYEREIEAYTKVLPAVEKCFNSIGISGQIAPRCFMTDIEKRMLVFEDLRALQFKSEDKIRGLDINHLKLTLSTLAKWHAGTATLLLTHPELFEWYKKCIDYRNATMLNAFYANIATNLSNTVKTWPGYENIANKLKILPQIIHDRMYDKLYDAYHPRINGFNVITHGDMFMNNILFRYDANKNPFDIRFIDFPLGKHTCPSIDLVCLLYGSASSSIKQSDREHLIKSYHSELIKYLKLLQFPGNYPSLLDIQSNVFRVDSYNALIVLFILGLRYVNMSFDGGFLELLNDDDEDNDDGIGSGKLYSHPDCIAQLKYLLDLFDRRGYFDF